MKQTSDDVCIGNRHGIACILHRQLEHDIEVSRLAGDYQPLRGLSGRLAVMMQTGARCACGADSR